MTPTYRSLAVGSRSSFAATLMLLRWGAELELERTKRRFSLIVRCVSGRAGFDTKNLGRARRITGCSSAAARWPRDSRRQIGSLCFAAAFGARLFEHPIARQGGNRSRGQRERRAETPSLPCGVAPARTSSHRGRLVSLSLAEEGKCETRT